MVDSKVLLEEIRQVNAQGITAENLKIDVRAQYNTVIVY